MLYAAICKSTRTIHIRITTTIITVRSLYRGDTFQYHGLSSTTISANMLLILISILFLSYITESVAETSYAKVSRNGQLARDSHDFLSWITKTRNDTNMDNENRSIKDIAITWSPVYVSPSIPKLKKGEAADYPLTPRYSTLDHETIAKLDATTRKKQIQHRFTPTAVFSHSVRDTKAQQNGASMNLKTSSKVKNSSSTFLGPIFPSAYDYSSSEFLNDKPISRPIISFEEYSPLSTDDKIPSSHKPLQNKPNSNKEHEGDYSNFDTVSLYDNNEPVRKPMEFINYHDHSSTFMEPPYEHDPDIHHDVIYNHVPEYEEHHKDQTTKEPEMMNDQRLDKRPYSYYFIGKKLWYIPLYFSIYFIIYIAALVLKSIARHKISLPAHLAETVNHSKRSVPDVGWWHFAERIFDGIESSFIESFDKIS